jgi:hypothetical protein
MNNTIEQGKTAAITSYILGIGVFIAMSMNADDKNTFASFHIRQGLGLTLTFISLGLIISNFDSNDFSTNVGFYICPMVLWYFQRHKRRDKTYSIIRIFSKWLINIS